MGRSVTALLFGFLLLTTPSFGQDLSEATCDVSNVPLAVEPGATAILSTLIGFSTAGLGEFGCGAPDTSRVPAYEALLWALGLINQDSGTINGQSVTDSYVPGIKLGLRVLDTCGRPQVAHAAAAATLSPLAANEGSCFQSTDTITLGVLDGSQSDVSSSLASLMGEFHIPQISYSSTSSLLSDVTTFPTFLRTIPSDSSHIQVILETLSALEWTKISVVYTNDDYGNAAYDVIRRSGANLGVCVSFAQRAGLDLVSAGYQGILAALVENEANAVVYLGGLTQARGLMEAGASVAGAGSLQWVFPANIGASLALVDNIPYARGAITFAPAARHIPEFEDHWVRIDDNAPSGDDPWYTSWYMELHQCHLTGVTEEPYASLPACTTQTASEKRSGYMQDPHVMPAITAMFTYARALRDAQEARCGTSSSGLCNDLLTLSAEDFVNDYLRKTSFTFTSEERVSSLASSSIPPYTAAKSVAFDENGDLVDPSFDIWNYNDISGSFTFEKIGAYINGELDLDTDDVHLYDDSRTVRLNYIPPSECPATGCDTCILSSTSGTQHAYVPGDVVIGAMFSIHKEGGEPFSCGSVDAEGDAQLAEAFLFALDQVVTLPDILPNVRLGGLVLDDCASAGRAVSTLTDFISGVTVYEDNADEIQPSSVHAVIGGKSDDVTKSLADVTNGIKTPFLPYKSGSTLLSEINHYSYITRIVASDGQLAAAVASTAVRMGWKHVQLVYNDDDIGRAFLDELLTQGVKFGLCVNTRYSIRDYGDIDDLAGKVMVSEVKAVVVRLNPDDASALLRSMSGFGNAGDFAVLAARGSWSSDPVISDLIPSLPMAVLSLEAHSPPLTAYTNYLQNIEPGTPLRNPWFTEWYQTLFDCYLDAAERSGYTEQCTNAAPITAAEHFRQHPYAIYVINAVYAMAYGLDATLKDLCGNGYQGVCADFHDEPDIARKLTAKIQSVVFTDVVGNPFNFIGDSGAAGFDIKSYANGYMNSVGTFTVTTGFLNLDPSQLPAFASVTSQCPAPCPACHYTYPLQPHMVVEGDIMLGMLVDVHHEGDGPFACGELKFAGGFQFTEALRYALDIVNKGSAPVSLNGVKLGGLALDSCTSTTRASNQISGVYSGALTYGNVNTNHIAGWITAGETMSAEINDVIAQIETTHVSAYTTAPSTDGMFQTVSSGETLSLGIVKLMSYMGWKYVQVVRSPNYYGMQLNDIFETQAANAGICVTSSFAVGADGTAGEIASNLLISQTSVVVTFATLEYLNELITELDKLGTAAQNLILIVSHPWGELLRPTNLDDAIVFDLNSPSLLAFDEYMAQVSADQNRQTQNPWFVEFVKEAFQCDIGPEVRYGVLCYDLPSRSLTTGSLYRQDNTVQTTINAVYAYAGALDLALKAVCGENYDNVCDDFVPLSAASVINEKLAEVTYTDDSGMGFEFTNGANELGYILRRWDSDTFVTLGNFAGSSLEISDLDARSHYEGYTVSCDPLSCRSCSDSTWQERVSYVHGDILIGGLFDVHLPGATPFTCGSIDHHQAVQLVEAFNFALAYVNGHQGAFSGILQGLTLGGVAMDSCGSATRSTNLLGNVHSGLLQLQVDDIEIEAERIDVYVTGTPDDVTALTTEMLTLLGIPVVSFKSSNTRFDDETLYPFFLRSVPTDNKQAEVLAEMLSVFNVDYIQVVSSGDVYGNQTADDFIGHAKSKSICIAQHIVVDSNLGLDAARADVAKLLLAPFATTVVSLVKDTYINTLLSAVEMNSDLSEFRFLGSTSWADSDSVIVDLSSGYVDAVTLALHRRDVPGFNAHMLELTPATYTTNPWFTAYYESVMDCSIDPESESYAEQCADDSVPVVQSGGYTQDILVPYVINSVHAAAMGIHHALQELCGDIYFGVCEEYRNNAERRQMILRGMASADFDDVIGQPFRFTSDGDGATGYQVFTVVEAMASGALYYENVGSYSDTTGLVLPPSFDPGWSSSCSIDGACQECPIEGPVRSRVFQKPSPEDLNLVLFIDAHHQSDDDALMCGHLDIARGFQHALAFLYAIDLVNSNSALLLSPAIKLGGVVIDTCSSSVRVTQDVFSLTVGNSLYDVPSSDLIDTESILAYMPYGSDNALAASSLLSSREALTLSPSGPSDELTDTPYFLRTVQAYTAQAKSLAELVSSFNWGYISMVYSDDDEGRALKDAFMRESAMTKIRSPLCIGGVITMPPGGDLTDALDVVRKLDGVHGANVVVVLTNKEDTRSLLKAVMEVQYYERFIWVAGTAWGRDMEVVKDTEEVARGAISIDWWTAPVSGFIDYVSSMTLTDHKDIPDDWFEEFWQRTLECRLDNSSVPLTQYTISCHENMRLSPQMIAQDEYVLQTIIATYMVAQGLNDVDECDGDPNGLSKCLSQLPDRSTRLYQAIRDAQWPVLHGELSEELLFMFDDNGDGNTGYNVYNYRVGDSGQMEYVKIGSRLSSLEVDHSLYYSYDYDGNALRSYPVSQCPDSACVCRNHDIVSVAMATAASGLDPMEYFYEIWGIVIIALACVGLVSAIVALIYLFIYYPNRQGTTVLGYLLVFGVICMYALIFAFVLHDSVIICGIRRFGLSFVYSICFSCLLIKVMNNWRVGAYEAEFSHPTYERLAHPVSILFIAIFLILVQVIISTEWLILVPPSVETVYQDGHFMPVCSPQDFHNEELIISCTYPLMLILLTLIFAAVTWDSHENHRESRWVLFTCVVTIGIWLLWTIVSAITEIEFQEPAVAVALLVNATIILFCLAVRKIVLLVKYQKHIDENKIGFSGSAMQDFLKDQEHFGTLRSTNHRDRDDDDVFVATSQRPNNGDLYGSIHINPPDYFGTSRSSRSARPRPRQEDVFGTSRSTPGRSRSLHTPRRSETEQDYGYGNHNNAFEYDEPPPGALASDKNNGIMYIYGPEDTGIDDGLTQL